MRALAASALVLVVIGAVVFFLWYRAPAATIYYAYYCDDALSLNGRGDGYFSGYYERIRVWPMGLYGQRHDDPLPLTLYFDDYAIAASELSAERVEALGGERLTSDPAAAHEEQWVLRSRRRQCVIRFYSEGNLSVSLGERKAVATAANVGEVHFAWKDQQPTELPLTEDAMIEHFGPPERLETIFAPGP